MLVDVNYNLCEIEGKAATTSTIYDRRTFDVNDRDKKILSIFLDEDLLDTNSRKVRITKNEDD